MFAGVDFGTRLQQELMRSHHPKLGQALKIFLSWQKNFLSCKSRHPDMEIRILCNHSLCRLQP